MMSADVLQPHNSRVVHSRIALGPKAELHNGIHGALLDAPPAGIAFTVLSALQHSYVASTSVACTDELPIVEAVHFGPEAQFVHSSHWPVMGSRGWIVDSDDVAYPLFCGHYALTRTYNEQLAGPLRELLHTRMQQRAVMMLRAYLHPSCKGMLLFTERDVRDLVRRLERVRSPALADALMNKVFLCRPAVRPCDDRRVEEKWDEPRALRVVFCGRWFEQKRGPLALRVFHSLKRTHPDGQFYMVGPIPDAARQQYAELLNAVTHLPRVSRAEMLDLLASAHVLFHPSRYESFGAVLLEAAAAGMAVIAADDEGMEHMAEWFPGRGALLVHQAGVSEGAIESAFREALLMLLRDPAKAEAMGQENYQQVTSGCLSLAQRDRVLTPRYEEMIASASPALTAAEVQSWIGGAGWKRVSMDVGELITWRNHYAAAQGLGDSAVQIPCEL